MAMLVYQRVTLGGVFPIKLKKHAHIELDHETQFVSGQRCKEAQETTTIVYH